MRQRIATYLGGWLPLLGLLAVTGCQAPSRIVPTLPSPLLPVQQRIIGRADNSPPPPPAPSSGRLDGKVIVVDPGHGGKDPGTGLRTTSRQPEKHLVLSISKQLAAKLQSRGARVVMTRSTDVFIELDDRAKAADRNRADLFVSIHADSAQRASASGTGVHIYTQPSARSQKVATSIVRAFNRADIETRGIFRSNFHVLREHSRPATLIECGFLTNRGDAAKLNDPAHQARLVEAIANGIADGLR